MNLAILSGNLGRDPELRTHGGDNILNFAIGVATGTREKPETMWVDCALWGKRATSLQPYLFKGSRVTVSGPLKLEEYQAKDGTTKTIFSTSLATTSRSFTSHSLVKSEASRSLCTPWPRPRTALSTARS